jgi:hypothetical protein
MEGTDFSEVVERSVQIRQLYHGACQASCRLVMPLLWFYSLPPTLLR